MEPFADFVELTIENTAEKLATNAIREFQKGNSSDVATTSTSEIHNTRKRSLSLWLLFEL